jgi:hypothetical protein
MKVFMSHAHDEKQLAEALKTLFGFLAPTMEVWYSSDRDPSGGVGTGRWREKIGQQLKGADIVLAIFTPESANRPWIFFESGFASALDDEKKVIPIVYYMNKGALPAPLQEHQGYRGDDQDSVLELCERLVQMHTGTPINKQVSALGVKDYLKQVEIHSQERLGESLFHGHFHDYGAAKKMEGEWFSKWTQLQEDGKETVFETHPVKIWTTKERLRVVGEGKDWADYYPMEGVVSSKGNVAMSYWSQGEIPICGTALLELIGGNRIMEGIWEGYTAKTLKERTSLIKGRVVIARDRTEAEQYWGLTADDK